MSVPILRPWPNQLAPPKQVKPQGVPKIDWSHPLAQGLTSYWYDTGLGFYVDLVRGDVAVLGSASTYPPTDASLYGTGFKCPTGGPNGFKGPATFYRTSWSAPYAYAVGWLQRGAVDPASSFPTYAGLLDASGNDAMDLFQNGVSGNLFLSVGNGNTINMGPMQTSGFHVAALTTTGASAQDGYLDGALKNSFTQSNTYTNAGIRVVINQSKTDSAVANEGTNSSIFFFAIWERQLTAAENQLLWTDPYCFLVSAEPEMSQLVQAFFAGGISPSRTILRPWPNQLAPSKQVKPEGVPRIDWSHPLAQGLVSYWYDTGLGSYIDLVTGDTTVLGAGSTFPTPDASPYGTGFKFNGAPKVMRASQDFSIQNWAWPYSAACGWFQLGAVSGSTAPTYFGIEQTLANSVAVQFFVGGLPGGTVYCSMADQVAGIVLTAPALTSGFHVAVGVADGASHSTGYLDGLLKGTDASSTAFSGTNLKAVFGGYSPTSVDTGYCNAQVFFGAIWTRVLEAEEAKLLYTDPYCFLVPAEPEMSQLVLPILGGGVSPSRTILRPWPNQLAPSRKVTPPGVSRIDWSHPLAQGLIGAYVPGISGGVDISDLGPKLTFDTSAASGTTSDGPGLQSIVANSGMFGTATPAFKSWTEFSIFWRGTLLGAAGIGNCSLAGVSFATPEATPFVIASMIVNPSIAGSVALQWNSGGTFANTAASSANLSTNVAQTAGATFKAGGNAQLYMNGKADVSLAFGASGPTSGATSAVEVGEYHPQAGRSMNGTSNVAFFWNRQLSADEMALLDRDPYCFLIPAEPELQALPYNIGGGIVPPRTILRPWPNQLATPKQVKPQGVPQIDWGHPLAQKLVSYWYDTGLGYHMDLVSGEISVPGVGGGYPDPTPTPYGTGLFFPTSSQAKFMQSPRTFSQQAWAHPYSFAMAIYQDVAPAGGTPSYFQLADTTANAPWQLYGNNSLNKFYAYFGNAAGSGIDMGPIPAAGAFEVFAATTTGASSQLAWRNGVPAAAAGTQTSAYTGTAMKIIWDGLRVDSFPGSQIGAHVFFGAVWNRQLTDEDARLLYTDPYCLLIPAEPEMTLLAPDVLMPQIWM